MANAPEPGLFSRVRKRIRVLFSRRPERDNPYPDGEPSAEELPHQATVNSNFDDEDLHLALDEWNTRAHESGTARPLRIAVAGRGGVGKSTLVNKLIEREDAQTGRIGKAVTRKVQRHDVENNGITLQIFDTPGMQDTEFSNEQVIANIASESEGNVDVFLYCHSLQERVDRGDEDIIQSFTKLFGSELWKGALFVLTFANVIESDSSKEDYIRLRDNNVDLLRQAVKKSLERRVSPSTATEIVNEIPFVTAGYNDSILKHEGCNNWEGRLLHAILSKADPVTAMSLLQFKYGELMMNELSRSALTSTTSGVLVGSMAGAGVGACGGPILMTLTVPVGAILGAASTKALKGQSQPSIYKQVKADVEAIRQIMVIKAKIRKLDMIKKAEAVQASP